MATIVLVRKSLQTRPLSRAAADCALSGFYLQDCENGEYTIQGADINKNPVDLSAVASITSVTSSDPGLLAAGLSLTRKSVKRGAGPAPKPAPKPVNPFAFTGTTPASEVPLDIHGNPIAEPKPKKAEFKSGDVVEPECQSGGMTFCLSPAGMSEKPSVPVRVQAVVTFADGCAGPFTMTLPVDLIVGQVLGVHVVLGNPVLN